MKSRLLVCVVVLVMATALFMFLKKRDVQFGDFVISDGAGLPAAGQNHREHGRAPPGDGKCDPESEKSDLHQQFDADTAVLIAQGDRFERDELCYYGNYFPAQTNVSTVTPYSQYSDAQLSAMASNNDKLALQTLGERQMAQGNLEQALSTLQRSAAAGCHFSLWHVYNAYRMMANDAGGHYSAEQRREFRTESLVWLKLGAMLDARYPRMAGDLTRIPRQGYMSLAIEANKNTSRRDPAWQYAVTEAEWAEVDRLALVALDRLTEMRNQMGLGDFPDDGGLGKKIDDAVSTWKQKYRKEDLPPGPD